jgi:hypothetical protein
MRLRYSDIVSFPVTSVLSVTLLVDIQYRDLSLTVVTNIVRSGLDSLLSRLLGFVWHVIASASSARTNGALAAARTPNTLTDHQLCRLPLQTTRSCTITQHRHTQDHCSQSLQLLTALVASLHRPQGALSSTSSHKPTHLQPAPRLPGTRPEYQHRCRTIYHSSVIQTSHTTPKAGIIASSLA